MLHPLTPAAHAWVAEHLPEDATWWCGAVVVEHRYIGPIVGGAIGDGLLVRRSYSVAVLPKPGDSGMADNTTAEAGRLDSGGPQPHVE